MKTGGMDRPNYALAKYLAERGDEVHLVAYRVDNDLSEHPNVAFHRVPKIFNSYFLSGFLLDWVGRFWASRISKRGGRVVVNGGNCRWGDVNWVHHIHVVEQPKILSCSVLRVKLFVDRYLALRKERSIIPLAKKIITTCEKNKEDLVEQFDLVEKRIYPVYLGIDPKLFKPANPKKRIKIRQSRGLPISSIVLFFIGALGDYRKGFDSLFSAWKILYKEKDWRLAKLFVVGRGITAKTWKELALKSDLASQIIFFDFVENLPQLLSACDALVLPSRYEGYSMVAQEAICSGVPAFVTAKSGISERYPKELDLLVLPDPEDVQDLVRRLVLWRQNRESIQESLKPFSEQLRANTWENMAKKMVDIIEAH